jgi:hypothetical protein
MRKSKQKFKDLFEKVEDIEKNTREKINKLEIYPIKELVEDKYFSIEGEQS